MDIDDFDLPNLFLNIDLEKHLLGGVSGVKEFNNPMECVDKLEILLRNSLNKNKENMTDPI